MEGHISVIARNQNLAMIVWYKQEIIQISISSLKKRHNGTAWNILAQLVHDYNTQTIIIESNFKYKEQLNKLSLRFVEISLIEAKNNLLQKEQGTHQEVCEYIVRAYPQLKRFIPIDKITNKLVLVEWRHTIILLCAVIGHTFINQ